MTEEETFQTVCVRSAAQYVFDLASVAAQEGSEVFRGEFRSATDGRGLAKSRGWKDHPSAGGTAR